MAKIILEDTSLAYGISVAEWFFVTKTTKTKLKTISRGNNCKDYLHEAIANKVHHKDISLFCGYPRYLAKKINLEQTQLIIGIRNLKPVRSAKRYINSLERQYNKNLTRIHKCNSLKGNCNNAYYIEADRMYMESPALLHWLIALIRTTSIYPNEPIPVKQFESFVEERLPVKDTTTLQWCIKNKAAQALMKYHTKYIKPIPITNIYNRFLTTENTWCFHSGFGMKAVQYNKIHSPEYRRAIQFIGAIEKFKYSKEK